MNNLFFYHQFLDQNEIQELANKFSGEKKETMLTLYFANLELTLLTSILSSLTETQRSSFMTTYLQDPSDPALVGLLSSQSAELYESLPEVIERTMMRLFNKINIATENTNE